jgi:hypothetical protein
VDSTTLLARLQRSTAISTAELLVRQEVGLVGWNRKIEIAEIVAAGVDVQAAIGARQAIVIAVAPHPANI